MDQLPDFNEAVAYYLVFLLSTTLHEAAHALAALKGGDQTAYQGGQVSLDPVPHIRREPVGMVALPLISVLVLGWPFGFASTPYDPSWARRHPRRAAWMSLAGPGANLLLVVLAGLTILVGMRLDVFFAPDQIRFGEIASAHAGGVWSGLAFGLGVVFSLNLALFLLNMLPLPPLDGSGALPLLLSDGATSRYQEFLWSQPALGWIGILVAWQLFDELFWPLFIWAVNVLYPWASYA